MASFQVGINLALLVSIFSVLSWMLRQINIQKQTTKNQLEVLKRNGQLKMTFIFLFFCVFLVWYMFFLLGVEGVLQTFISTPVFISLGAFIISFKKYVKNSKC